MKKFLSKKNLAKSLNVSQSTIDRMLNKFPHYKLGNTRQSRVLFEADEVSDYLSSAYAINKKKEENQWDSSMKDCYGPLYHQL